MEPFSITIDYRNFHSSTFGKNGSGSSTTMARGRPEGLKQWMQSLGDEIGAQLGHIIAESLRRTLENEVDLQEIVSRLQGTRRGRSRNQAAACSEAECGKPVLAKGLC